MKFAITSPASAVKPEYVEGAANTLEAMGHEVEIMPHALGHYGSYSGTVEERLSDFVGAYVDPTVDVVLCSRGGYGAVHLLPGLESVVNQLQNDPKWLVGFSDITALHAFCLAHGLPSLHASMAKQLALGPDNQDNQALMQVLEGYVTATDYEEKTTPLSRVGACVGTLVGGNLAVMSALFGTPYDMIDRAHNPILFIEDIAEPIYKVERILWQMKLAGKLDRLRGLIVGQFTDYRPSADHASMEQMIAKMMEPYSFPVAFNFPIGHVDNNAPIVEGAKASLAVFNSQTHLTINI